MRSRMDAFDVYCTIAALSFFNISNRYVIRALFRRDMGTTVELARHRVAVWEIIRRYISPSGAVFRRPRPGSRALYFSLLYQ